MLLQNHMFCSKVSLKYDSWHKDALGKFGAMLGSEMSGFHAQIAKARAELEQQTLEAASTSEAVNIITDVQGRNSIDIFFVPESVPEPVPIPNHVWSSDTCLSLQYPSTEFIAEPVPNLHPKS